MKKNTNAGFTLIELMVVVVILGILSSIAVVRIPDFMRKAREGKTKGNLATLRSTINIYYSNNEGTYPKGTNAYVGDVTYLRESLVPMYIKSMPPCHTPPYFGEMSTVDNYPSYDTSHDPAADGEWVYVGDETDDSWGTIFVECWDTDSNGNWWSSF